MTKTMRPGIYTDYTITPVSSGRSGRAVGIAARTTAECEGVQVVTTLSQAKRIFGESSEENVLMQMLTVLFAESSPVVYAAGVTEDTESAYQAAIDALCETDAYLITLDRKSLTTYQYLRAKLSVKEEKLGIVTGIEGTAPDVLANTLNHERVCLAVPEVTAPGQTADLSGILLAVLISGCDEISGNLNGETVEKALLLSEQYPEEKIESYLTNGICVFEERAGVITLIRGMTTKTKDDAGGSDTAYRNLGIILTIDTVIPALRELLREKLNLLQNNQAGLNTILSLVVCRLDDFVDEGLISEYQMPRISLDAEDSSVCIVEVAFTVRQGISSIYLTAHISI